MRKISCSLFSLMSVMSLLALAGCRQQQAEAPPPPPEPPYMVVASIRQIMGALIDPSADAVWDSVKYTATPKGMVETIPRTDEDWLVARNGALRVIEGANLLLTPGRHVGGPNDKSAVPGIELEPVEIDASIAKERRAWENYVKALQNVNLEALKAVEAKDTQKLYEVGSQMEDACEQCHTHFWYPNQGIPGLPSPAPAPATK